MEAENILNPNPKEKKQKAYNITFMVLCIAISICIILTIVLLVSCNHCVKHNTLADLTKNAIYNFRQ